MRILTTSLVVAVMFLSHASGAWAQTVDEVIDKSIAAMGGRAAHEKLKSRMVTGTITLTTPAGDITGPIEVLSARPNKSRTLIKADLTSLGAGQLVVDQRFDGTAGFVLDSLQGDREMSGNQLDNAKNQSFPHPYLNYKEMGIKAELGSKEKVGNREALVVTFTPKTGSVSRNYIDATTFLPIRVTVKVEVPQIGELEQTIEFLDYKDVDGVKVPFRLQVTSAVQSFTVVTTKVDHNVTVDESLFSKPKQ